ncbi:hypothetical protein F5148DRAFT_1148829 [Russula earlei]|uniref:Uncharacterized protein n=1 Tax=Russula earlei TaxID=71964 RepID=A0ACC0UAL2_9AGAM|nr:hypothetical protein F5148DRAFT_1148829 [Russula earlei]
MQPFSEDNTSDGLAPLLRLTTIKSLSVLDLVPTGFTEPLKEGPVVQPPILSLATTRVANSSEDDEDGWAKFSMDETDWCAHHAMTPLTLAKQHGSHSGGGSEPISEHDRTRKDSSHVIYYYILLTCFQAQRRKRFHGGTSERSDSPTNQSQDIMSMEIQATPWAIVSVPNQGKGNMIRSPSCGSIASTMTHTEWAQEDRTSICAGSLAEVDCISPTDEHMQDPERFYAPDLPISHNSDLEEERYATPEEEWYATAEDLEEVLKPEDHSGEQVGGSSVRSHLKFNRPPLGQSQLMSQLGSHTPIVGPTPPNPRKPKPVTPGALAAGLRRPDAD